MVVRGVLAREELLKDLLDVLHPEIFILEVLLPELLAVSDADLQMLVNLRRRQPHTRMFLQIHQVVAIFLHRIDPVYQQRDVEEALDPAHDHVTDALAARPAKRRLKDGRFSREFHRDLEERAELFLFHLILVDLVAQILGAAHSHGNQTLHDDVIDVVHVGQPLVLVARDAEHGVGGEDILV